MMRTYISLADGTQIGYAEPLANGTVKVGVVRLNDGGFSLAVGALPQWRWLETQGYEPEELAAIEGLVVTNASLIVRLAQEAAAAQAALALDDSPAEGPAMVLEPAEALGPGSPDPQGPAAAAGQAAASDAQVLGGAPGSHSHANAAAPKPTTPAQDYSQAAAAVLDAASLVGRVMPATKVGRLVNTAMPAARTVAAAAPGIVEKAAPVVTQAAGAAAEAAPRVAEKAARGIGRLGSKIAKAAAGAVDGVVDGARQAAENYHRENRG